MRVFCAYWTNKTKGFSRKEEEYSIFFLDMDCYNSVCNQTKPK